MTLALPASPEALAKALAGTYEDEKGAELVIARDGLATRADTHWSPPDGPVSHAVLGLDEAGKVVLHEWSGVHDLGLDRRSKNVQTITLLGRKFRRD